MCSRGVVEGEDRCVHVVLLRKKIVVFTWCCRGRRSLCSCGVVEVEDSLCSRGVVEEEDHCVHVVLLRENIVVFTWCC